MPRTIAHSKKDKRTKKQKQAEFIEAFCQLANVTKAAKKARIGRRTVYDWLNPEHKSYDSEFASLYEEAEPVALGVLEDEAARRAIEGVNKPIYYKGSKVGTMKEYSDTLMIVLLKARAPEKYRERVSSEITGKGGKDLIPKPTRLTKEQIDKLIDKL